MEAMRLSSTSTLRIGVTSATGVGPTALAAFDAALVRAGVANFNLVRLSSVIPPGSIVSASPLPSEVVDIRDSAAPHSQASQWGDRLYAVWAVQTAELLGQEAWAGVAWIQDPEDQRGLFVEHEGHSEAQVRSELEATLNSIARPRGLQHLEQHSVVVGTTCEQDPVAALVIAPFSIEPW